MEKLYHIRPADKSDFQKAKALLSACHLPAEGVVDFFDQGYCVAQSRGDVVGVAGIEEYGPHGLLRSVAVSPAWQRKSIGVALVQNRLSWAASRGISTIYLITIDAAEYFKRFDFQSVDRNAVPPEIRNTSEFSTVCPETATVMVKTLIDQSKALHAKTT